MSSRPGLIDIISVMLGLGGVMLGHCRTLDVGYEVPNIKMLFSVVDYGRFNPILPVSHPFPNIQIVTGSDICSKTSVSDPQEPGVSWTVLWEK